MSDELDARGFAKIAAELARISGRSYEDALKQQAGALLGACMSRTPAPNRQAIIKKVSAGNNFVQFDSGHIVSFWKKADALMFFDRSDFDPKRNPNTPAPKTKYGFSWHAMDASGDSRRWSAERWARWSTFLELANDRRQNPKGKLKTRGLAKQTWYHIAENLGVDIRTPAYVKKATGPEGETYREGLAETFLQGVNFFIEMRNSNPVFIHAKLNGRRILQKAIKARQAAFAKDLEKGVFDDVKTRAARYPGLFLE